jgi:ABC-type lipoprotein release transport system permease subunit
VREVDANIPLIDMSTQMEQIERRLLQERVFAAAHALSVRESLILVGIGAVIGVAAAVGAGRFVASLLFELGPADVTTSTLATAVMIAVSAFAGYLPARRASRLDPMVALRHD